MHTLQRNAQEIATAVFVVGIPMKKEQLNQSVVHRRNDENTSRISL